MKVEGILVLKSINSRDKVESLSFGMIRVLKIHRFSHNFPLKKISHNIEKFGPILSMTCD